LPEEMAIMAHDNGYNLPSMYRNNNFNNNLNNNILTLLWATVVIVELRVTWCECAHV